MVNKNNTKAEILSEYRLLVRSIKDNKIEIPTEIKNLGEKNTKTEILSAVRSLEKVLKENEDEEISKRDNEQLSLQDMAYLDDEEAYEENGGMKPDVDAHDVNADCREDTVFLKEDEELKLLNQDILDKIHSLEQAKRLREQEYENLTELERELEKCILELNKAKDKIAEQDRAYNERIEDVTERSRHSIEELENELKHRVEEAEANLLSFNDEKQNIISERDKARNSEQEQYSYDLSVSRKQEDDAWSDEAAKIKTAMETTEEEISDIKEELKEKEQLVPELKEKLEELPKLLEKAKQQGEEIKQKELEEEYTHQIKISNMDFEAETDAMELKIKSLREDYEALMVEKNLIQEKLDKAYDESNKLYLQTIQSTGGVRILNNFEKK